MRVDAQIVHKTSKTVTIPLEALLKSVDIDSKKYIVESVRGATMMFARPSAKNHCGIDAVEIELRDMPEDLRA